MVQISPELFEKIVQAVASALHDIWRKERNYDPRPKPISETEDAEWIKFHQYKVYLDEKGQLVYDIANTKYADLTRKWQLENEASARIAISIIRVVLEVGCPSVDDIGVETASSVIHTAWLERNGAWAEPLQKLNYFDKDFPDYERERDRVVWREAVRIWKEMVK